MREGISIAFATSTWDACYIVQPTKRFTSLAPSIFTMARSAVQRAEKAVARFSASRGGHIATALAESIAFRTASKPYTVVAKLMLTDWAIHAFKC